MDMAGRRIEGDVYGKARARRFDPVAVGDRDEGVVEADPARVAEQVDLPLHALLGNGQSPQGQAEDAAQHLVAEANREEGLTAVQ